MDRIEVKMHDDGRWEWRVYKGDMMMCGGVTDSLKKALDNAYRDTLVQNSYLTKEESGA